ncbi:MAG: phage integrase N-terminal domain-containing protein [bacterium]|nr:phage integrase N-terminal domain-containing protein [bacterium]
MTVNSLRKQAVLLMKNNKDGNYKERKRRAFVLEKMLHELYALKQAPASWQDLETRHFHFLVKHWKDQRVKSSTIMRYMTIIRKVLTDIGCHVAYIDNRSLLLSRPKPLKKHIKMSADFWQCLTNPAVRLIMALQTHFGLTFQEAIHFKTSTHVQNNQLMISDRSIPISTKEQNAILKEFNQLMDEGKNIIKKYGQHYIRIYWHSDLKHHKLPGNRSWRYWYAKQRFESLLPEAGYTQTCQVIRQEMGIKSRNTLCLYLKK